MKISIPVPESRLTTKVFNNLMVIKIGGGLFAVQSDSRPGDWHPVYLGDTHSCTCESFMHSYAGQCKHTVAAGQWK